MGAKKQGEWQVGHRFSHACRRDREERDALTEAAAEKERLRNMTPSERAAWEKNNPKVLNQAPKKSWKFMQKYWHKGAFFQEVSDNPHAAGSRPDDIFMRDYSAPTGEDKLNREMLPKVKQPPSSPLHLPNQICKYLVQEQY